MMTRRTRETFRPSSVHSLDTMWTVRYGEQLIRTNRLDERRTWNAGFVPLSDSPAKRLAVEIARTYAAQYAADDEGRWNDSGSLGAAAMAMTTAYTHLAAIEHLPYVSDGEAANGADLGIAQ